MWAEVHCHGHSRRLCKTCLPGACHGLPAMDISLWLDTPGAYNNATPRANAETCL